jgi:hypothetical protein
VRKLEFIKQERKHYDALPMVKKNFEQSLKNILQKENEIRKTEIAKFEEIKAEAIDEANQEKAFYYFILIATALAGFYFFKNAIFFGIVVFIISLICGLVSYNDSDEYLYYKKKWSIAFFGLCIGVFFTWVF